jgi:ABC-2 type transport system permease protein
MEFYGAKTANGIVVEGDKNYCVSKYNHYLLPKINDHAITAPFKDSGYYILMPIAEGINVLDDHRDTVSVTQLLTTSDKAYAKAAGLNATTMDKEAGDTDGPFALGVAITDSADGKNTKIVWYTTSYMLDDSINSMVSGANLDLLTNSLNWMCERENKISISSKSLKNAVLTIPAAAVSTWSIVLAGIVPLVFLAAGVAVWFRRRRK